MNEAETVKGIPCTGGQHEGRVTIGRSKVLQRTHLLNYFKKLRREFQPDTSNGDEDYKSGSTDLERFLSSRSNTKGRSPKGVVEPSSSFSSFSSSSSSSSSSSLLWIQNERRTSKAHSSTKEFRETCNSFKDDRSSGKHRLIVKQCYGEPSKSVDRVSTIRNRNFNSKSFRPFSKLRRQCRRRNADKWSNIRRATNIRIGDSWSEGNVENLRNNDSGSWRHGTTCKGSSVPLFTTERVTSVRACTCSNRKCNIITDIFDSRVFISTCALRRNIPGATVQFLVTDDLNHSEILHCEELLKHEREKVHRHRLRFGSGGKAASKGHSRSITNPPTLTKSKNIQCSAYKETDCKTRKFYHGTHSPVWEGDYQPARGKNRKSFGRNNDKMNTLTDEQTVTCKNNASACYKRRKEKEKEGKEEEKEQVEKMCKLVNTCRGGKRFSSFYETAPQTQGITFEHRSDYCLCPEYAQTRRDRLEISLSQHVDRSSEATKHGLDSVKNSNDANEMNVCRAALHIFQQDREEDERCVLKKYERNRRFVHGLNQLFPGKNFPLLTAQQNRPLIEGTVKHKASLRARQATVRTFGNGDRYIMSSDKLVSSAGSQYRMANERNPTNRMRKDVKDSTGIRRVSLRNNVLPVPRKTHDSCSRIEPPRGTIRKHELAIGRKSSNNVTCCCLFADRDLDKYPASVSRAVSNCRSSERARVDSSKSYLAESCRQSNRDRNHDVYRPWRYCCRYENRRPSPPLERKGRLEMLRVLDESKASRGPLINLTNVRVVKPKGNCDKANIKKVHVYPPRGEAGPPLTLYKNASNINCTVMGDTRIGFRYNVTYTQKFASPAWYPEKDEWASFSNTPEIGVTILPTTAESHRRPRDFTKRTNV